MIKRYSDHSANERTYLAWIRTSIAIMAFGFLIEKFDIFVSYVGQMIGDKEHFSSSIFVEFTGLCMFLVGIIMIITATFRFFINKEAIASEETVLYDRKRINIILSSLMVLLALFLFGYMLMQAFSKM